MTTKTFTVPNISCGHCTHTIEMELRDLAGVKEVKADEPIGAAGRGGLGADPEAGRVRGKNRCRRRSTVQLAPEGVLEFQVFRNRLDDEPCAGYSPQVGGELQPAQCGVALDGRQRSLLQQLRKRALDAGTTLRQDLLGGVPDDGLVAGGGGRLGDPAAHKAAPQHANGLDRGH